jgi:predicted Zn-ribbon and HTH transcriptional regulator
MVIQINPKSLVKKVKCKDCGTEFETKKFTKFPRKYCKKCSEKRKKDYENIWQIKAEDCVDA